MPAKGTTKDPATGRFVKKEGSPRKTVEDLEAELAALRADVEPEPEVVLEDGLGGKVFDDGTVPANVTLLEPPAASGKGTVFLRYGLAEGVPGTGDMSAPDRGIQRD